jgi:hypothetical protein
VRISIVSTSMLLMLHCGHRPRGCDLWHAL